MFAAGRAGGRTGFGITCPCVQTALSLLYIQQLFAPIFYSHFLATSLAVHVPSAWWETTVFTGWRQIPGKCSPSITGNLPASSWDSSWELLAVPPR